jgi:predicted enzyme related to lactoylglutathione lyase
MLQLDGKDAGALFEKDESMKDVPTHWASYISVTSADEIAAKAKALGGTVMKEPFDVMDAGRMAVIIDPTGAPFSIWQAGKHHGYEIKGQPNTVSWNELLTTDTARAIDFYSKLFGWVADTHGAPMEYTEWKNGDEHAGGMMQIAPHMGPVPPHWGIYFAVDDCDAMFQKATSLGARAFVPPMDIENVGRFAVIQDPQGAVFSIIKLTEKHEEKK